MVGDSDQDWRLRAELHGGEAPGSRPHGIVGRFRGPEQQAVQDAERAIGPDVVLTHDGSTLFAYARDRSALEAARSALERAIEGDGLGAEITISHWEDDVGDWAQVDPPPPDAANVAHERAVREAHEPTTQTFVVEIGREVRSAVEQAMQRFAGERNLTCEIVEHPHLLRTQVAFTVSGARHDVNEFRSGLDAEERQTIRTAETMSFSV